MDSCGRERHHDSPARSAARNRRRCSEVCVSFDPGRSRCAAQSQQAILEVTEFHRGEVRNADRIGHVACERRTSTGRPPNRRDSHRVRAVRAAVRSGSGRRSGVTLSLGKQRRSVARRGRLEPKISVGVYCKSIERHPSVVVPENSVHKPLRPTRKATDSDDDVNRRMGAFARQGNHWNTLGPATSESSGSVASVRWFMAAIWPSQQFSATKVSKFAMAVWMSSGQFSTRLDSGSASESMAPDSR